MGVPLYVPPWKHVRRRRIGRPPRARHGERQQIAPADQRAERQAAADGLAKCRQIGRHAVQTLRACQPDARPHHHFVEDQHDAAPGRLLPQDPQEGGIGVQDPARHRLDDHRRDIVDRLESRLERGDVVPRQHHRLRRRRFGNAVGRRPGRQRLVEVPEHVVVNAVIVALELHDPRSPCRAACQPQRVQRRLSARTGEAHHLRRGQHTGEALGQSQFQVGRRSKDQRASARHFGTYGFEDARMAMARDQWAKRQAVVDVLAAVHVPDARALGARHVQRVRREELDVRRHAGRQALRRLLEHRRGRWCGGAVVADGVGQHVVGGLLHQAAS